MVNFPPAPVRLGAAVVLATLCSGCTTVQKFKCNRLDWASLGLEDGKAGKANPEAFESRSGSCLEVGATVDESDYLVGYEEGLTEYCTTESGLDQALSGDRYRGVCPADAEADFLVGYDSGLESYCTKDSGYDVGSNVNEYLEICPVEVQQEFLHGYVAGLDAATPNLDSRISTLSIEVTLTESRLGALTSRISSYQNLRSSAKKKGNEALVDFYDENLSASNSERRSVEADLRRSESALSTLRRKRASVDEWMRKWQASLL